LREGKEPQRGSPGIRIKDTAPRNHVKKLRNTGGHSTRRFRSHNVNRTCQKQKKKGDQIFAKL